MADGTQLAVRSATMLPHNIDEAKQIASYLAKSNLFGCKTPEQAFALMLLADAEGLHPGAAARDYHVIEGKPSLRADAMLARYMSAGGKIKWLQREPEVVTAEFTHPSSGSVTITWDRKRAELAGFWQKANWRKHPVQMLSARVISEGVRASFPGVVAGIYTPEEVQDFDAPRQSAPPAKSVRQDDSTVIDAQVVDPDATIDSDQMAEIDYLLTESNADRARFYAHLRVDGIADITVKQFPAVKKLLERKLKEAQS